MATLLRTRWVTAGLFPAGGFTLVVVLLTVGGPRADEPVPAGGGLRRVPAVEPPADYRTKWSIVVGIDRYRQEHTGLDPLHFAANDARAVHDLLRDEFGFRGGPEKEPHILRLTDEQATKEAIEKAFTEWLPARKPQAEDAVLVYFAGHGLIDPETDEGYFAAFDSHVNRPASLVPLPWVRDQLVDRNRVPCRHRLIIFDCCYSGKLFAQQPLARTAPPPEGGPEVKQKHDAITSRPAAGVRLRGPGRVLPANRDILTQYLEEDAFLGLSAGRNQPVDDGDKFRRHSRFTEALLAVMLDRADSQREDQAFSFRQLAAQVESRTRDDTGSAQVPNWGRLGHGDGDFVFRPTTWRLTPAEKSTRQGYLNAIQFAGQAFRENDRTGAADTLAAQLPRRGERDRRGFEWWHLKARLGTTEYEANAGHLLGAVQFASVGGRVVVVSPGLETGRRATRKAGAAVRVEYQVGECLACSADGKRWVLAGSGDVSVHETKDLRTPMATAHHPGAIRGVAFAGELIVSVSKQHKPRFGSIRLWRQAADKLVPVGQSLDRGAVAVAASDKGGLVAIALETHGLFLLTGDELRKAAEAPSDAARLLSLPPAWAPDREFTAVSFSRDGRLLACVGPEGVEVLDPSAPRAPRPVVRISPPLDEFTGAVFAPDNRRLYTTERSRAVRCFRASDGKELWCVPTHAGAISLSLSPDGRYLATASFQGEVSVWDVRVPPAHVLVDNPGCSELFYSPNGAYVAGVKRSMIAPLRPQAARKDSKYDVHVWHVATGEAVGAYTGLPRNHRIDYLAVTPDGETILLVAEHQDRRTANFINLRSGKVAGSYEIAKAALLRTTPDGRSLILVEPAGEEARVRLWRVDLAGGQREGLIGEAPTRLDPSVRPANDSQIAVSPDGRWLALAAQVPRESTRHAPPMPVDAYSHVVKVWDLSQKGEPNEYGLPGSPRALAFNRRGTTLHVLCYDSRNEAYPFHVIDPSAGRTLSTHTVTLPSAPGEKSAWSIMDGRLVGSQWGRLKCLDVVLDRQLLTFPLEARVLGFAVSPVGDSIAVAVERDGLVLLRDR